MEVIEGLVIFTVLFIVWWFFFREKKDKRQIVNTDVPYVYTTEEKEILELINKHRGDALTPINYISQKCLEHNHYQQTDGAPSHDYFNNRGEDIKKNLGATKVGEIIVGNLNKPESIVLKWLGSKEHKAILENPEFTHIGLSKLDKYTTAILVKL